MLLHPAPTPPFVSCLRLLWCRPGSSIRLGPELVEGAMSNPRYPVEFKIQTANRVTEKKLHGAEGSAIRRALDYSLKRWAALSRHHNDGAVPIDTNWAENQIRPWALGRKN